ELLVGVVDRGRRCDDYHLRRDLCLRGGAGGGRRLPRNDAADAAAHPILIGTCLRALQSGALPAKNLPKAFPREASCFETVLSVWLAPFCWSAASSSRRISRPRKTSRPRASTCFRHRRRPSSSPSTRISMTSSATSAATPTPIR